MSCNTSADCQNREGVTISRLCYENAIFSDEEKFCECSTWFGWEGDSCDEISGILIYNRIFSLFIVISLICFDLLLLRTLILHLLIERCSLSVLHDDTLLFGVFFFSGFVCVTVSMILISIPYFDPTKFAIVEERQLFLTGAPITDIDISIVDCYITIILIAGALLNIGVIFAYRSLEPTILKMSELKKTTNLRKFFIIRIAIYISTVISVVITLILVILKELLAAMASIVVGLSSVTLFLIIAIVDVKSALKPLNDADERMKGPVNFMQFSISAMSLICSINIVSGPILLFLLSDYEGNYQPYQYNIVIFLKDLCLIVLVLTKCFASHAYNSISIGPIYADFYPILCFPFSFWDRKNRNLNPE